MTFLMPTQNNHTKCRKKNPLTCRLHSKQYRKFLDFANEARKQRKTEEQKKYHSKILQDLKENLKPLTDKNGITTISVFRSGIPSAPKERGIEKESYQKADLYIPEGRQGRTTGVFASPTIGGVSRWVAGNNLDGQTLDIQVRELRINPNETYVYPVREWEKATWYGGEFTEQNQTAIENYWASGITMTEWVEKVKTDPTLNPTEWELLISSDKIENSTVVSPSRVQKNSYTNDHAVEEILKKNKKNLKPLN